MIRAFLLCLLLTTGTLAARGGANASARFARLQQEIRLARRDGKRTEVLSKSLELAQFLHHSGPSTEQVALAYAALGTHAQALAWLREFAAMGQSDDELASRSQFASIKTLPEFRNILATMHKSDSPIDRATAVIGFHDAGLLPEDIDYDAATRSFLVTSVLEKKIVRLGLNGTQRDFAGSPDGWPVLAIKIDARNGVIWATEVAMAHFTGVPSKDWGRSALFCLRLKDGALIRKIDAPHTALGDMALMPNGDAIVSDGDNGGVYRAHAGCTGTYLQRVDSGQFISPQTPAALPDGRHVYIPDYVRGVAILDVKTGQAQWLDGYHKHAMQGIDGLYLSSDDLLAIQNGASPERVVAFGLNSGSQIANEKVIDRSSQTLGDPTHGVVIDGDLYYIANSGWSALDDHGRIKAGAKVTPAVIKKVPIAHLGEWIERRAVTN